MGHVHGIACSAYTPTHTGVRTQGYTPTRTRVHAPVLVYVRAQARASPMILSYHRWEVLGLGKIVNICPISLTFTSVGLIVTPTKFSLHSALSTTATTRDRIPPAPHFFFFAFACTIPLDPCRLPLHWGRSERCDGSLLADLPFLLLFPVVSEPWICFSALFGPKSLFFPRNRGIWAHFLALRPFWVYFGCNWALFRENRVFWG